MPHLTIEYSKQLGTKVNVANLLTVVHESLDGIPGIDMERLKSRVVGHDHVLNGKDASEIEMIHVTLDILAGRDTSTKKTYSQKILQTLKQVVPDTFHEAIQMSVNIRDMDSETYSR